jgi:hypothetical protein
VTLLLWLARKGAPYRYALNLRGEALINKTSPIDATRSPRWPRGIHGDPRG